MKVNVIKANSFTGHRDCVYALTGSEGRHFYSSGGDGMIVQWDLDEPDKGELLAQVATSVYALNYISKNQVLVVGQNFEGLQLVDVEAKRINSSMQIPDDAIFCIRRAGDHLLVGLKSGLVLVLEKDPIKPIKRLDFSKHSARTISVSKVLNQFAVGYSDNKIRIFDLDTFSFIRELIGHSNSVFVVKYSPDGGLLLSGGRDAHIKAWECNNYTEVSSIAAHMYAINDLAFSPNGKHFVTCSMDKSIKVWDYSDLSLIKVID